MTVNLAYLDEPRVAKCKIEECPKGGKLNRGWCAKHYSRWRAHGDPMGGRENFATPEEALSARVEQAGECLVWTGSKGPEGYGTMSVGGGRIMSAHRFSYQTNVGPIPVGMFIDHICHNPACIKPSHLRPVTHKQNMENQVGAHRGSKSGFRGVYWSKQSGRWKVQVNHYGKRYHGGLFADVDEANRAAVELRNKLHTHNDADRVGVTP